MKEYEEKLDATLVDTAVAEPEIIYSVVEKNPFVDPLNDWAFKRIFASEANKEVAKAFLNEVLKGKREIVSITYGKNEYPGEIKDKRGAVLDFVCIDKDGTSFLVELQRKEQTYFKDRSLFYTGRLISDQAPKGKEWDYKLKAIYVVSLLEESSLPGTDREVYLHNVALCDVRKGTIFYDKLHFVYIELEKFNKAESALETGLDKWIYSLKNASKMTKEPIFAGEMSIFFESARCAKFTEEELKMYRTAQQQRWDNQNVLNHAKKKAMEMGHEEGFEEGRKEGALGEKKAMVLEMLKSGIDVTVIATCSKLSIEDITTLK